MNAAAPTLRSWTHGILSREEGGGAGSALRTGLVLVIIVSVVTALLKSVPAIEW